MDSATNEISEERTDSLVRSESHGSVSTVSEEDQMLSLVKILNIIDVRYSK